MRTRTGDVIWASILLVLAAVAFSVAVFDLREYQAAVAAWIVVGLGGVFVVGALVALIVRTAKPAAPTASPAEVAQTVGASEHDAVEPAIRATSRKRGRARADQPVD